MMLSLKALKKNNSMLYSCCLTQTKCSQGNPPLRQHVIPKSVLFRNLLYVKGEIHAQLCQKKAHCGEYVCQYDRSVHEVLK